MNTPKFIPLTNEEMAVWLNNFSSKLPLYSAKYFIHPDEVADMQQSSKYFTYVVGYHQKIDRYKIGLTAFRDKLRDGDPKKDEIANLPALPTFDPPPVAVPTGIFKRAAAIAQRIKKKKGFLQSDGYDLGIIAPKPSFNPQTAQPTFSLRLVGGGHPEIAWKKGKMDGVEIYVKRNPDETFSFYAYSQYPNYIDMHALPPEGTAAVWSYRLIYRYKDNLAGFWSSEASITVSG